MEKIYIHEDIDGNQYQYADKDAVYNVNIGDVTSLSAGSSPTASASKSGNTVTLNFGIPKSSTTSGTTTTTTQTDYMRIFHKIGVVGDSLSSGEIAYQKSDGTGSYNDRYEYSWLANIARTTGASYVHYCRGGLTTKSWLEDAGGYKTKLSSESQACSAYFIALCTNDAAQSYGLGSASDSSSTTTFAGYYKKIIETIRAKNPNATLFLVSAYRLTTSMKNYSNMISQIANLYSNCYYVDLLNNCDLLLGTSEANMESYGHYTTLGYVRVADNIHRIVNSIIASNTANFKFFALNNTN